MSEWKKKCMENIQCIYIPDIWLCRISLFPIQYVICSEKITNLLFAVCRLKIPHTHSHIYVYCIDKLVKDWVVVRTWMHLFTVYFSSKIGRTGGLCVKLLMACKVCPKQPINCITHFILIATQVKCIFAL